MGGLKRIQQKTNTIIKFTDLKFATLEIFFLILPPLFFRTVKRPNQTAFILLPPRKNPNTPIAFFKMMHHLKSRLNMLKFIFSQP